MSEKDKKAFYREELDKPLEEIKEDMFFRADNFRDEPWYGEFLLYTRIDVCQPAPEHALEVRKALKIMGYPTHTFEKDGKLYIASGEEKNTCATKKQKRQDRER